MDKKLRIRETKDSAQVVLLKLLPLLFMLLMLLASSTVGAGMTDGGLGSGID